MAQLFQNDVRWKDTKIGLQNSLTISQVGCLLTSLAMVVNHYGGNITPASLNDTMKAMSGFNGAWIKSAQVPSAFPQLGMKRQKWVECEGIPAPMDWVDQGLNSGSLIVVRVDWSADPGIQGHWVVIHTKEDNDYLIWDPWNQTGASNKLIERYGLASKNPADIILEAIWHGKGDLAAPGALAPSSTDSRKNVVSAKQALDSSDPLAVKPTISQLSLRQQPVTGNIQKLLSTSDVLMVIESGDAAAKIGKSNQWLQVRTSDGQEGYVAAWFVQKTEAPAAISPQPETPTVSDIVVKTTIAQVSFRSQAIVSTSSFIRTLTKGTELTLIEAADKAKIGQQGQWLKVRAEDGKEGFVAAWLVAQK